MGIVSGVLLAIFYKNEGPQRRKFSWELEDEATETEENEYWHVPPPQPKPEEPQQIEINYIYKEAENSDNQDKSAGN
jgi:hypothetical protein